MKTVSNRMRDFIGHGLLGLLVMFTVNASAQDQILEANWVVKSLQTTLYDSPTFSGAPMAKLQRGLVVEPMATQGAWVQVNIALPKGWDADPNTPQTPEYLPPESIQPTHVVGWVSKFAIAPHNSPLSPSLKFGGETYQSWIDNYRARTSILYPEQPADALLALEKDWANQVGMSRDALDVIDSFRPTQTEVQWFLDSLHQPLP